MLTLIRSPRFKLTRDGRHYWLRTTLPRVTPTARRVGMADVRYLKSLSNQSPHGGPTTFEMACLMDYGLAVFQK